MADAGGDPNRWTCDNGHSTENGRECDLCK